MRISGAILCLLACSVVAAAQDEIRYPPLARQARIQGDVFISHGTVVSGNPLLVPTAVAGLTTLGATYVDDDVVFHFVLQWDGDYAPIPRTVHRANAFGRFFLRVFGRKTRKNVLRLRIQRPPDRTRVFQRTYPSLGVRGTCLPQP